MICFITMVMYTNVSGMNVHRCDSAKNAASKFIVSQKNDDWDNLEISSYKLQYCKCEIAPIFYYIYRMKVILPNSQALKGVSPDDFILSQKLKMEEQIQALKSCEASQYLPLVNAMISQNFDADISEAGDELKSKLLQGKQ